MSSRDAAVSRHRGDTAATIVLLIAHGLLVFYTVAWAVSLYSSEKHSESRCRTHNLDCRDSWLIGSAWTAVGVSAVLIILDVMLVIRRRRRLSFFVPLLFCVAQIVVVAALAAATH
ncbi:MAG: hypothetical protein JO280_10810 [Mycobacteriaceae bacterium]|nr:hypothetical protein [Mycobacteriaceae bacterium]